MTYSNGFNYYPSNDDLLTALNRDNHKKLNLFIDLKGCMQSLYIEDYLVESVRKTEADKKIDSSLLLSALNFVSYIKQFSRKYDISTKMYFFYERGESFYHIKHDKDYKKCRSARKYLNLTESQVNLTNKIKHVNFTAIEKVLNFIPDVCVYNLQNLEADFIPYYLLNYVLDDELIDATNIIMTGDKDMHQCLDKPYTYQFIRKTKDDKLLLDKSQIYKKYLKNEKAPDNLSCEYFPIVLSVLGDLVDDVPKAQTTKCGPVAFVKDVLPEFEHMFGTPKEMYDRIKMTDKIFKDNFKSDNKHIAGLINNEKRFVQNMYLTSFWLLSEVVEDGTETNMKDRRDYIYNITDNTKKILKPEVFKLNFEKLGIYEDEMAEMFDGIYSKDINTISSDSLNDTKQQILTEDNVRIESEK